MFYVVNKITSKSVALLAFAAFMAVRRGYSPVSPFSTKADAAMVAASRARFT